METRRPTSPAAEEILGGYFPVLDHGFVALVDYMGGDDNIERAARVSYGYGTRKVSQTRGLIRYLRRHRHTTPSEMVELMFHVAMPIFVARQWIRHRTACLAAGTQVYFDLPGGIERRGDPLYKVAIEDLWRRFQPTRNRHRPDKQRNPFFKRDRVREMRLRQMDEDTGAIRHTRIVDVFRNGIRPVFRMTLADGKRIVATADHRFRFDTGWGTLQEVTGLEERNGVAVWRQGDYHVHVNGAAIELPADQDREWLRWTTQATPRIHERNGWTCQLCLTRAGGLHCHHIVPVWAEPNLTRDESNLTTLCGDCHRRIAGRELDFVEALGGPPVRAEWRKRPRTAWNRLAVTRLVRIENLEFLGERVTYDLEVEGPHHNFIAEGIVTHNSVNEYSARYSLMPLLFYRPEREQFAAQAEANRQGRESAGLDEATYEEAVRRWDSLRATSSETYEWLLEHDLARELARIDLPLSTYTQWYWKIDLHNLLHFLSLRVDPHAQWEIQAFARVMAGILKRVAPLSFEAWVDYELTGTHLSRGELEVIRHFLEHRDGHVGVRDDAAPLSVEELTRFGLAPREARELIAKLEPTGLPDFELDLTRMRSAEEMGAKMAAAVPGQKGVF